MPGNPRICSTWSRTGKTRLRTGWRGRMVVQVEESQLHGVLNPDGPQWGENATYRWRDARLEDFSAKLCVTENVMAGLL